LDDNKYPEPNYFVINPIFTDLESLSEEERKTDYAFIAFYRQKGEEQRRQIFEFLEPDKELIAKFYPTEEKYQMTQLINYVPHFLLPTLLKIKNLGPYVEIYKL
jgi:hypothetical protein